MPFNLSLLPEQEKNKIELDKQASFLVWQLRAAKCGPDAVITQAQKIVSPEERAWFEQSVAKYKRVMGVA
ncbi:DUF3283 family protein [Vibrio sp. SM6]|uniref:DUF3283 family protein n=1 Tax=Vibrio agarilyticus TaxID=2726741 RepID=A0A7X8YG10_9VIBR|nr:DUF3283 family protein [Vibrio agarilyticus]NLS11921.1 DUF3283 family protein [Vibrio agarilyticus]